jgi:serine phosphatase RsbU (regulator of sigma subunit)
VRWIRGRGAVTLDDHGNVTGTIGCAGDVTEGKLVELERERRAVEAERLAIVERRQRERLEFLTSLNAAALVGAETRELMRTVTRAAVPQLGDWCALHFAPEPGEPPIVEVAHADPAKVDWALSLQERYPYDPDASTGVPAVIRTGSTEFLRHIDAAFVEQFVEEGGPISPSELRDILDALQLTSVITVPLITKRGVLGAVQFVSAESKRRYDDDDLALAEAAAGRIAEVLEASWMLGQHRTIAATLQSALLPPALPAIDGVGIEARYWAAGPASDVGGDFYDAFRVDDDTWALVIGDVCGTGAAAAAVTAIARHTIRAAATHGHGHREVIDWLDAALRAGGRDRFCTVVYATLERSGASTWHLRLVSGGHPLPVLCRADGSAEVVGTPGTLVGILSSVTVTPTDVELGPGDTLVLYTDGVTDVPPPHQLDEDDLLALVSSAASDAASAHQIADRLGSSIETHLSIRDRPDDVAVLVVRLDGAG